MIYSNKRSRQYFLTTMIATASVSFVHCQTIEKTVANLGEITGSGTLTKATADLTPKQEHYLGRGILARVLAQTPALKSTVLQGYINKLGQYLALHSNQNMPFKGYRFVVVNEKTSPIAMSAPGGFVMLSSAMMRTAQSEDQIAAVLAHEISHIVLRHAQDNIKNSNRLKLGKQLLTTLASQTPNHQNVEAFSDVISAGLDANYNQKQEIEADTLAIAILEKSGYSPQALLQIINKMPDSTSFFSKHPRNAERISNLSRLTATNKKDSENYGATKRFIAILKNNNLAD